MKLAYLLVLMFFGSAFSMEIGAPVMLTSCQELREWDPAQFKPGMIAAYAASEAAKPILVLVRQKLGNDYIVKTTPNAGSVIAGSKLRIIAERAKNDSGE